MFLAQIWEANPRFLEFTLEGNIDDHGLKILSAPEKLLQGQFSSYATKFMINMALDEAVAGV